MGWSMPDSHVHAYPSVAIRLVVPIPVGSPRRSTSKGARTILGQSLWPLTIAIWVPAVRDVEVYFTAATRFCNNRR
jgi:hypothetical protein